MWRMWRSIILSTALVNSGAAVRHTTTPVSHATFTVKTMTGNGKIHGKRKNLRLPELGDFKNLNNPVR